MIAWLQRPVVRAGAYAAFGCLVFVIALGISFPDDQVKDIVAVQIEKQLGPKYDVEIGGFGFWWLTGVKLTDITIQERVDPSAPSTLSQDEIDAGIEEEPPLKVTVPSIAGRFAPVRSALSLAPAFVFRLGLGGGNIDGHVALGSTARKVYVDFNALDLRKTTELTAFLGVPFFGELSGEIDLELDPKRPMVTGGTVEVSGDKLTIGPETVKTDKFPPITYLEVPQTNFGTLKVRMVVADPASAAATDDDDAPKAKAKTTARQMEIEEFTWGGRDTRGDMWGTIRLASRVGQSSANVQMRMQFDETFVTKNNLAPFLSVPEVRKGKNKEWFGLRLTGRLQNIRFRGAPDAATGPQQAPDAEQGEEARE